MGHKPTSFVQEFTGQVDPKNKVSKDQTFTGAGFAGESAQQEFIKRKDPVEQKIKLTKNKIYVFDLTNKDDLDRYEQIIDKAFDPESGIKLAEPLKDPTVHIDEKAPLGYRAIVVVKTTKPVDYVVRKGTGYNVVKKASETQK